MLKQVKEEDPDLSAEELRVQEEMIYLAWNTRTRAKPKYVGSLLTPVGAMKA
jgi:hypothetical protein